MADKMLVECEVCAEYNYRKAFSARLAAIPVPDEPFRHIMLDFVDMSPQIVNGKRYVRVVMC